MGAFILLKTCCFIGHRKIVFSEKLCEEITQIVERLIEDGLTTFLFGSRSQFNELCLKIVTDLKNKYPRLNRIYVRAEYEVINNQFTNYLLQNYERTYFAERAYHSGKAVYIKRNQEMIDNSDICIFYYDKFAQKKLSGTKIALDYAVKKQKSVINVFN